MTAELVPTAARTPEARLGQRRSYLTILFSDLCDSTGIAAALEAEDYSELLGRLRQSLASVIDRHGGTVVRIDGDGMLAIFGHPAAREDDGRRACEAALDLHDAAARIERSTATGTESLCLHTGIYAGLVLLETGDLVRGAFEMLGDATNIAARLVEAAGPGEILVGAALLGTDRHFFCTGERRLIELNRGTPVAALSITGREPVGTRLAARSQRGLTPFVGRLNELGALGGHLDAVIAGGQRLVAITGPPGLGKTRLAGEILSQAAARGCLVYRGYCESYLAAEPLQPFVQIIRSATSPPGEAYDAPQPTTADAMTEALRETIDGPARSQPLVLFIDDWQCADDASRQVLSDLWAAPSAGIMLLIATRAIEASDGQLRDVDVVRVQPLTSGAAAAAIAALLPDQDPFAVTRIGDRAGGNPLFIEELCHCVRDDGDDRLRDRGGTWLASVIESRFARLTEAHAKLARTAAVIGSIVPVWLFELLTGCDAGHPLVLDLADADFLFPGDESGTLRFKHGIVRDVIYNAVGLHRRRALHREVAEALLARDAARAGEELFGSLAYHFAAGGDHATAADYATRAGDKALAVPALDRAQAHYRAALTALEAIGNDAETYHRWALVARQFGLACVFDPSRDQLPTLARAVGRAIEAGNRADAAVAAHWLACIHYGLGESRLAIVHGEQALAIALEVGDERLALRIRTTLGQACASASDYPRALTLLDAGIASRRPGHQSRQPPVMLSYSRSCKAFVLADLGRFVEAEECFETALAAIGGSSHQVEASVLTQRSAACLWRGHLEDAERYASAAQRVAERVKTRYLYAMSRALRGYARWQLDGSPEGFRMIVEATTWLDHEDRYQFVSLNYGWLADAMVATGQIARARHFAGLALARARKDDRLGTAMAWRALARAAAQGHGRRPPAAYLERAMRIADRRQSMHEVATTHLCRAEIAHGAGDRGTCLAALADAQPAFAAMGMTRHVVIAEQLRAGYR